MGEQRLVGGDDMLAVGDRFELQVLGDRGAADQLDDDVDLGRAHHLEGIAVDACPVADLAPRELIGALGDLGDLDRPAGAPLDLVRVAIQDFPGTAADRADAEQADTDGFHAAPLSNPSLRNRSRTPRAAWRRRSSFSMSAMRTWSSP